jgi:transposase
MTRVDTVGNIASFYLVNPNTLRRHFKKHTSGFNTWEQKEHCEDYLIFPENIGPFLSIDEVSLSKGELYTFVTNKSGHGKKGSMVACVKGTLAKDITDVLQKLSLKARNQVLEVTLDMANNMELAAKESFPKATLVTDRFHVVRLAIDALQHIRIKHRWEAIDEENKAISDAKNKGEKYESYVFSNGDTKKQLLARSRYVIAKKAAQWTENQCKRAHILFNEFPDLKKAYEHIMEFRNIYEEHSKANAEIKLKNWLEKTSQMEVAKFNSVSNTIQNNLENILAFFNNRSTNANAESFNSKIKLFRANLRGVTDTQFFLFRLTKLFA